MRIIYINGFKVDIDELTAIGVTWQGYDFFNPQLRKVVVSNNFTLPNTTKNLRIFGIDDPFQLTGTTITDNKFTIDYLIDNHKLINQGTCRIQNITNERIELYCAQRPTLIDDFKNIKYVDILPTYLVWLNTNGLYNLPLFGSSVAKTYSQMLDQLISGVYGVDLMLSFGNLYREKTSVLGTEVPLESEKTPFLDYYDSFGVESVITLERVLSDSQVVDSEDSEIITGGHFFTPLKLFIKFLEDYFSCDFGTDREFLGNYWNVEVSDPLYFPIRALKLRMESQEIFTPNDVCNFYFEISNNDQYYPNDKLTDKANTTLYDFIINLINWKNIFFEPQEDENTFNLYSSIDFLYDVPVVDFSGNTTKKYSLQPTLEGFGKDNYIKFKNVFTGASDLTGSPNSITYDNENVELTKTIVTINSYASITVSPFGGNDDIANLSETKSFENLIFFQKGSLSNGFCQINFQDYNGQVLVGPDLLYYWFRQNKKLSLAKLATVTGYEDLFIPILQRSRCLKIEKYMNIETYRDIRQFAIYYFKEFGGSYLINKINGFNPEKSKAPTELELIWVSTKTPIYPANLEYFVDGILDPFVDGDDDYFY